MPTSVKRTISFTDTTIEALTESVPKSKRSKFIDNAVIQALQQLAKQKALDALEKFQRFPAGDKSVVETLREIRQSESDKIS